MDSANIEVTRLYVAMFGRAPDVEGLAFWSALLASGQKSVVQIADMMFGTAPARTYFPEGASNSEIIGSFYVNVLGRLADAEGLVFWRNKLGVPGATPGSVIEQMVDVVSHYTGSDSAGIKSAVLFNNRVDASSFYAENGGGIANATRVIASVTIDSATVSDARTFDLHSVSSAVDIGGFSDIHIQTIGANAALLNAPYLTDVTIDSAGSQTDLQIHAFDPATADTLFLHLPGNGFVPWHLTIDGFKYLDLRMHASDPRFYSETVELDTGHLEEILLTGHDSVTLGSEGHPVDAAMIAAFDFDGVVTAYIEEGTRLIGRSFGAFVIGIGMGGTVEGGPGDDLVRGYGSVTLLGRGGHDQFEPSWYAGEGMSVIGDFEAGMDRINFDQVVLHTGWDSTGTVPTYGTWTSSRMALAAGSSFDAYLDAAAAGAPKYAAFKWFQFDGDTYVVVDNSAAATFQDGEDAVVKLVGLVDLHTAAFNIHTAILG
jgi:hypothetical protein